MLSLSSAEIFQNKLFKKTFRVSNGLDPDSDQYSVCSDLGPNCLQRLSAHHKIRG